MLMLKPHAEPPLEQEAEDPPPLAFGPTEKSLDRTAPTQPADADDASPAATPIDAAYAACRAVGGGHGAFGNAWTERLHEIVHPSYGLLRLTHDQPAELARLARLAEIPITAATEKNPALFCVKLAARPKDTDQNKICSEWSTLLRCALAQNISSDGFIAWVRTTSIRECKATIARENVAARAKAGQPPQKRGRAQLEGAPVEGIATAAGKLSDLMTSIETAVLEALTAPGSEAERRERVIASLRDFADSLASGGMIGAGGGSDDAAGEGPANA